MNTLLPKEALKLVIPEQYHSQLDMFAGMVEQYEIASVYALYKNKDFKDVFSPVTWPDMMLKYQSMYDQAHAKTSPDTRDNLFLRHWWYDRTLARRKYTPVALRHLREGDTFVKNDIFAFSPDVALRQFTVVERTDSTITVKTTIHLSEDLLQGTVRVGVLP